MDALRFDAELERRLSSTPDRLLGTPLDVLAAQENPSKQFQLWDVKREEAMDPTEARDRQPAPRIYDGLEQSRLPIPRFRPEATRELTSLTLASPAARKAYKGLRALLKIALRKPYPKKDLD